MPRRSEVTLSVGPVAPAIFSPVPYAESLAYQDQVTLAFEVASAPLASLAVAERVSPGASVPVLLSDTLTRLTEPAAATLLRLRVVREEQPSAVVIVQRT